MSEEKQFELGDKYVVACRSDFYSPADSKSTCIVATKSEPHQGRAVFDFEIRHGEVLKAEVNLHRALVGTTIDADGKTNGELQPENDKETINNVREIQEVMKAKKSDWQVVSVIPIKEYEESYKKAGEKGDYIRKFQEGADIDEMASNPTPENLKKIFSQFKLKGGK